MKTWEESITQKEIDDITYPLCDEHPEPAGLLSLLVSNLGPLYMALHRGDRMEVRALGITISVIATRIAMEGDDEHTQHNLLFQGPPE